MKRLLLFIFLLISTLIFFSCDTTSSNLNDNPIVGDGNSNPLLVLNDPDTVNVDSGTLFIEPGYSALDSEDGNLTDSVKIGYYKSDKITTISENDISNELGTYFVKYTVIDSDGNNVEKWRTIIVKEMSGKPYIQAVFVSFIGDGLKLEDDTFSMNISINASMELSTDNIDVIFIDTLSDTVNDYFSVNVLYDYDKSGIAIINISANSQCVVNNYDTYIIIKNGMTECVLETEFNVVAKTSGEDTLASDMVYFDNFNINGEQENYTCQNYLGLALGQFQDSVSLGGGMWSAFASGGSDGGPACIYGFDNVGNADTIISLKGNQPESEDDVLKMFGSDSLFVALDAREAAQSGNMGSYYYAGVICNLAGVIGKMLGIDGATELNAKDVGASTNITMVTWDLSKLKSITIKGKIKGSAILSYWGVTSDNSVGICYTPISSGNSGDDFVTVDTTISMDYFAQFGWNGATWDEIKGRVSDLTIELDTESSSGGDYVVLNLDCIILNFDSESDKIAAFPFLR